MSAKPVQLHSIYGITRVDGRWSCAPGDLVWVSVKANGLLGDVTNEDASCVFALDCTMDGFETKDERTKRLLSERRAALAARSTAPEKKSHE